MGKVHRSIDHVNGFDSVDHMIPSESLHRYHFQELKSLQTARPNHPAFLPLLSSSNGLIWCFARDVFLRDDSIQFTWCQVRSVAPWQQNSGRPLTRNFWQRKITTQTIFGVPYKSPTQIIYIRNGPLFFCGCWMWGFFFEGSPGGISLPGFVFYHLELHTAYPKFSEPRFLVTFCSNPFCMPQKGHLMGILAKIHLAGPIFGQCDNSRHFDIPFFPRLMGFASTFP